MEINQGEKLRAYIRKLKNQSGIKVSEVAEKMGVTPEHLSTVFKSPVLSAEIRDKAIKALSLRADFFDVENGIIAPATNREDLVDRLLIENKDLRDLKAIHQKYIAILERKLKKSGHYENLE